MRENYCSSCGIDLIKNDLSIRCSLCLRNYHTQCWEKTRGCTTWGCAGKSSSQQVHYKRCEACGEKILDFAVKCRYCRVHQDQPAEQQPVRATKKATKTTAFRKDPILTCLLNLIFPGAGYMYLGHFSKGLTWFVITLFAIFVLKFWGMLFAYLWIMFDSTRQALMINRSSEIKQNKSL